MRLTLKFARNNEIRIGVESLPWLKKGGGDNSSLRRDECRHRKILEMQSISAQISNADIEVAQELRIATNTFAQLQIPGLESAQIQKLEMVPVACATVRILERTPQGHWMLKSYPARELAEKRERLKAALDITRKSQQSPKRPWGERHAAKEFTPLARHRILEAGAHLDAEYAKNEMREITLTLPGDTPEAIESLARWSGWIVNRLTQVIRRHSAKIEIPYFFVWEFQKRGALHMHWALACKDIKLLEKIAIQIKEKWYACMDEISEKWQLDMYLNRNGISWKKHPEKWQWSIQEIKRSIAAYYSKYVGKSAKNLHRQRRYKSRKLWYPSRWWGMSRFLSKEIAKWRITFPLIILQKEEAQYLASLLKEKIFTRTKISAGYSYEYLVPGKIESEPIASGKIDIIYVPPESAAEFRNYIILMRMIVSSAQFSGSDWGISFPNLCNIIDRVSRMSASNLADMSALMSALPTLEERFYLIADILQQRNRDLLEYTPFSAANPLFKSMPLERSIA